MDADRAALASARPAFQVGGDDQPRLDAGLTRLLVHTTLGGVGQCEAEFGNWGEHEGATGFTWFDRATLEFGKDFAVRLGEQTLFAGRIMALEGRFPEAAPPRIVVRAEDRLQDLRMVRRTRSFERKSDKQVFESIAADHQLQSEVNLGGPEHALLVQVNQSDLAFLQERALAADADLWLEGTKLHAAARASRADGGLELVHGARLRQFSVCADLAHQRSAVVCAGWDVAAKEALAVEAGADSIDSEAGDGISGPKLLEDTLGARKDTVAHTLPFDAGAARALAEAHLRTLARRFVRGRGVADADLRLRVGVSVKLAGLGPLFSGRYGVVEVSHRFDAAHGLRTEFVVERPWLGRPA
jgi:phage protein D